MSRRAESEPTGAADSRHLQSRHGQRRVDRLLRRVQRICFALGFLFLAGYGLARFEGEVGSAAALAAFDAARAETLARADLPWPHPASSEEELLQELDAPDQSLWSAERKTSFSHMLQYDPGVPEAVLRIPAIGLEVPVFDGTDEVTLTHGVARIEGTPHPGEPGNVGIAGHRDGFFRGLKDVHVGDALVVETLSETLSYEIAEISIVDPDDTSVLEPTEESAVTLVTCHPFYYVGHAPRRYIVRAVLASEPPRRAGSGDGLESTTAMSADQ